MLDTGLAADCTNLYVDSWTRLGVTYDGLLHMVRPAMAGGVLATCLCPEARPQMATVRPGVFAVHRVPRGARVVRLDVDLDETDLRVEVVERRISTADVDLRDADVVIAGGAGQPGVSARLRAAAQPDPRISLRLEFIPPDELQLYLKACDVVVLPFRDICHAGTFPSAESCLLSAGLGLAAFLIGLQLFRSREHLFLHYLS